MRENSLRAIWDGGGFALGGWLTVPSGVSAEIMAHGGFDWVCIDMQHGMIDFSHVVPMLQGISSTDTTPLVRVPRNEPGIIGKCLDAGAWGVIVPMVNTADEARAAVAACRYAPAGIRSYGPLRANYYAGFDYFSRANDEVLCIVMIETTVAVANVDEIRGRPGSRRRLHGAGRPERHVGTPAGAGPIGPELHRRPRDGGRRLPASPCRSRHRRQRSDRPGPTGPGFPVRRSGVRRPLARGRGRRCPGSGPTR